MTLPEAIAFLDRHRIPFQTTRYEDEKAYLRHCLPCPNLKYARNCPVTALVIPSLNGEKHIELQFNRVRGQFRFRDLWFGGYCFELSDQSPESLEADILDHIGQIVDGKLAFLDVSDLNRKRMLRSGCYDLTDSDEVFGAPGFQAAAKAVREKKSLWHRLTGRKIRYDIYTWKTCRTHVK